MICYCNKQYISVFNNLKKESKVSDRRYAVMFLRFGFLASVVFAVFWSVWHLSGHQVPSYTSLKFTDNILWTFPISRWWDIPFAFLVVNVYAWILRIYYQISLKFAEKNDLVFSLVASLVFSLVASLAASLGAGLFFGLFFGLVAGLGVGLGVGLVAGLCLLIKTLFSSNFWKPVCNWLIAKNIP